MWRVIFAHVAEDILSLLESAKSDFEAKLIVDTNVMMEIDSIGDLIRLGDKLGSVEACLASDEYRYRQLRARHSILVAWWLAQTQTPTGILGYESIRMLTEHLAPDSDGASFGFTSGVVNVIKPFVFRTLRIGALLHVNHTANGGKADAEILRIATLDKLPVITNEGVSQRGLTETKSSGERNLRGLCRDAGVVVYAPQEFLTANKVNAEEEAHRFVDACRAGVAEARAHGVLMDSEGGRYVLSLLVGVYRWIMLNEVDEQYAHLVRKE